MRLTMAERKAVVEVTAGGYRRSGKKEKGRILDEFTQETGYNRSYARQVLRGAGRKIYAGARVFIRKVAGPMQNGRHERRSMTLMCSSCW